jgi:site-specific recombinase XerD
VNPDEGRGQCVRPADPCTTVLCNHTWRATGITNYLEHGGALETAQWMAGHSDPRTTKLYDRRRQLVSRGEVERIRYERKPGGV